MEEMKILVVQEPWFYSYQDESLFFKWLETLSAVARFQGTPRGLEISLKADLGKAEICDLLAWMTRYDLDRKQIRGLCTPENEVWLKNPDAYWHNAVFGTGGRPPLGDE